MSLDPPHPYVSRGGIKLRHALDHFKLDAAGLRCVDLGCSTGGFTDCLLQAGAASVVSIDTGYGVLAWKLRTDPRVRVIERTNALHATAPEDGERMDLAVIDLGWTPQRLALPAALRWIKDDARIISLIKPHYELAATERHLLDAGVLPEPVAERVVERMIAEMPSLGLTVLQCTRSPILGSKEKSKGNAEWLALLARST